MAEETTAVVDENVDVEVIDEESNEPVITQNVATGIATKKISFAPIDTTLSPEERAPLVRKYLKQAQEAGGVLEIVQGELLFEAKTNEYWKSYEFEDESGTKRPYESWDEFCLEELGIKRRTSFSRIDLYDKYVNELALPSETLEKIQWSKAGLVVKLIDNDNKDAILDAIDSMTWRQVKEFAAALKTSEDVETAKAAVLAPKALTDESDVGVEGDGTVSAGGEADTVKTFSAKCSPAQIENIEAALATAASVTGSDSKAHNLDTICAEYLAATVDVSEGGEDAKMESLARIIDTIQDNYGVVLDITLPDEGEEGGAA